MRGAKPYRRRHHSSGADALATCKELADFLAGVERRAFKQAVFAVRDEDAALDVVQEAMMKLSGKYAARPAAELPLLFQRILQNAIRDHFRRQKARNLWAIPMSALTSGEGGDDQDPLETLESSTAANQPIPPHALLERSQVIGIIEKALQDLPPRQRQAFLLRYWEEMDVAEAAAVMGCSEGSVKTHCSRATHALAEILQRQGVRL